MAKSKSKRQIASHSDRKKVAGREAHTTAHKVAKLTPSTQPATRQLPKSSSRPKGRSESKQARIIAMLQTSSGATVAAMMQATGWQRSIRSVASSPLSFAKSLVSILYRSMRRLGASIGLRIAWLCLLRLPRRAKRPSDATSTGCAEGNHSSCRRLSVPRSYGRTKRKRIPPDLREDDNEMA